MTNIDMTDGSLSTPARPGADSNHILAGIACGMGAGALWGLVFLAPEIARDFTPLQIAIGRYLAFGLISLALLARRSRVIVQALSRRDWFSLAWLSLAGNTAYYVLLATAIQMGGIAVTSLVIGFLPVTVTIIGSRDHGAVPLRRLAPSLLLCTAGAACIGWQSLAVHASVPGGHRLVGLLCAIGALASWTAFAVGNSRCLARLDHVSVRDWNLLIGIVTGAQATALIPLSIAYEPLRHAASAWVHFATVSIGIAVAASIVANTLWNRMSRLLPLTLVGQMILFETLFALLYGFLWERRLPVPLEIAAFMLVVASVLLCIGAHRRHSAERS